MPMRDAGGSCVDLVFIFNELCKYSGCAMALPNGQRGSTKYKLFMGMGRMNDFLSFEINNIRNKPQCMFLLYSR